MAGIRIVDLKSATGDYARAYLFNVWFTRAPVDITWSTDKMTTYLVRSSSLPEETIEALEIPYQGQIQKIGTTHTYSEWTVTFNVDINASVRKKFVQWQRMIHDPVTNAHNIPSNYYGAAKVSLLSGITGQAEVPVITYTLNDIWPSSIGALEVAQDNKEVAQFEVTFTYNWHEVE